MAYPGKRLHLLDLFGGWPGGLLAQDVFRHKSSKSEFQWIYWGTVVANSAVAVWLVNVGMPDIGGFLHG